ncbi:MAG: glycoside hydrolase family 57 protein [Thermosphaera sp.]
MSSLVLPKLLDGLEGYIVLNKPVFRPGEEGKIHLLVKAVGGSKNVHYAIFNGNVKVHEGVLTVPESQAKIEIIPFTADEKPGEYGLELRLNDAPFDTVRYIVTEGFDRIPLLGFVWHHHQAPNYLPNRVFHSPWAFIYVYGEQLKPYGKGPYHYHVEMFQKHKDYKATYNLSPSLLQQWQMAIEEGILFHSGEKIEKSDERIKLIQETLKRYKQSVKSGQIDVLTSIYAHTIAGFISGVFNAQDIVAEELKYGLEITRKVLDGYEPLGAWTPEMSFSMDLVDVYYENRIEYTVLDDRCHFYPAEGEKNSKYEPYLLLNSSTGKHITVFFRDHELSDILGFKNNFENEVHAWRNAYETSFVIARKVVSEKPKILTLALDGENWMVFAKNPPLTAYFFDKLLLYLESLYDSGVLKMVSLREAVENVPVRRILTKIPPTTWLCTYRKWRGQHPDQEKYWVKAKEAYLQIKAYESAVGGKDEYSGEARWAIWHALDSDYWWAEFWMPKVIETWINEAGRIIGSRFSQINIRQVIIPSQVYENIEFEAVVEVENNLEKQLKLELIALPCAEEYCMDREILVKPRGVTSFNVKMRLTRVGKQPIFIGLLKNNMIITSKIVEAEVKPFLPASPS